MLYQCCIISVNHLLGITWKLIACACLCEAGFNTEDEICLVGFLDIHLQFTSTDAALKLFIRSMNNGTGCNFLN